LKVQALLITETYEFETDIVIGRERGQPMPTMIKTPVSYSGGHPDQLSCDVPQFLRANPTIVPQINPQFPSTSIPVYYSLLIFLRYIIRALKGVM
jgi:hypothetical protein